MKKILGIFLVVSPELVLADYNVEAEINYSAIDYDIVIPTYSPNGDTLYLGFTSQEERKTTQGKITYYFDKIVTKNVPLGEAAFLAKTSNITIAYSDSKQTLDLTQKATSASIQYMIADKYIAKLEYNDNDNSYKNKLSSSNIPRNSTFIYDPDNWVIGAGMYLNDRSTIELDYSEYSSDLNLLHNKSDKIGVSYKNLLRLEKSDLSLMAGIEVINYDRSVGYYGGGNEKLFTIGADWYLTQKLSIGGNMNYSSNGVKDPEELGISAKYFVVENASISINFAKDKLDNESVSLDTTTSAVSAAFRF